MSLGQEKEKNHTFVISSEVIRFVDRLKKAVYLLVRNEQTIIDHSLVDMKQTLEEHKVFANVHLNEVTRGEVNDITCCITDNQCSLSFKIIATCRFFAIRSIVFTHIPSETSLTGVWSAKRESFKMDSDFVEESVYRFLEAVTEVL